MSIHAVLDNLSCQEACCEHMLCHALARNEYLAKFLSTAIHKIWWEINYVTLIGHQS